MAVARSNHCPYLPSVWFAALQGGAAAAAAHARAAGGLGDADPLCQPGTPVARHPVHQPASGEQLPQQSGGHIAGCLVVYPVRRMRCSQLALPGVISPPGRCLSLTPPCSNPFPNLFLPPPLHPHLIPCRSSSVAAQHSCLSARQRAPPPTSPPTSCCCGTSMGTCRRLQTAHSQTLSTRAQPTTASR